MSWSDQKIKNHTGAAKILGQIKDEILNFIKNHAQTSELEVQNFAGQRFKNYKLKNEIAKPIIAFRQNTSQVHYFPSKQTNKRLRPNSLILIDIWGRLKNRGAPYADLTWIAYLKNQKYNSKFKNKEKEIKKAIDIVFNARDLQIAFIKKGLKHKILPTGKEIDSIGRDYIHRMGFEGKFLHGTGHELGFHSPHGLGRRIYPKNHRPIKINIGYTIEPGVYLAGKFGARSEINFYIDKNWQLVITTPVQKKLDLI